MAIKKRSKSVLKNIRQSRRRHARNLVKKHKLKTAIKKLKKAKTKTLAQKLYPEVQSAIDKAIQDGLLKKNTAARMKSRLTNFIKTQLK
jgi:small subunit ribosomal protein S20